ncbi:hypothetical protein [Brevundimonas sp.]|uniref:hypothetical protein n=1 Tax=Brevundimonas sp. TaxID=1871086 RepID=UPI002D71C69B|nr:hypothetical protein [Brevundimonas sp.]HYD27846.1 hypothetical protein [Brevundimonas sp.]
MLGSRAMRIIIAATLCVLVGTGQAAATAPQDDDWEFAEDPARQLTVAAARYDNGPSIVAQCREGALSLLLIGMPAGTEKIELNATRADGRGDLQDWRPAGADGVFRSSVPARDIRFMRGGGAYAVRTGEGVAPPFAATFDLPMQSANLDRVLGACGWAMDDERDQLARAAGASLSDPDARAPRRSTSRSITERRNQRQPPPPAAPASFMPAEQQISCVVRSARLADCRPDHARVDGAPDPAATLRLLNGERIYAEDVAAAEGKIMYFHAGGFTTVIDYIATTAAR